MVTEFDFNAYTFEEGIIYERIFNKRVSRFGLLKFIRIIDSLQISVIVQGNDKKNENPKLFFTNVIENEPGIFNSKGIEIITDIKGNFKEINFKEEPFENKKWTMSVMKKDAFEEVFKFKLN